MRGSGRLGRLAQPGVAELMHGHAENERDSNREPLAELDPTAMFKRDPWARPTPDIAGPTPGWSTNPAPETANCADPEFHHGGHRGREAGKEGFPDPAPEPFLLPIRPL